MLATYQFFKVKKKLFHLALAYKRALTSHFPSLTYHDQVVGNKEEDPGQPVAYPPLHGHRGSVYINRSYEKAEAREDPAHKEMIVIDYSGGGEEREARSPVQVVDLTSREEVKTLMHQTSLKNLTIWEEVQSLGSFQLKFR